MRKPKDLLYKLLLKNMLVSLSYKVMFEKNTIDKDLEHEVIDRDTHFYCDGILQNIENKIQSRISEVDSL